MWAAKKFLIRETLSYVVECAALSTRIKKGIINSGFQLLQSLKSFVSFHHVQQVSFNINLIYTPTSNLH